MKRLALNILVLLFTFSVAIISCKKSPAPAPAPTPTPVPEASLVITTNPVINSNLAPQPLGSGLPLTVTVTSAMPVGGVKIDVTAKTEAGTTNFFTTTISNSNTANNFNITTIPVGVVCVCNVVVTSLTTSTNVFTGSFRFSAK